MTTNDNGRIEVTDFIDKKLTDEEMEKIAGDKHFSICLMNPPYGSKGGIIHLQFVEKCLDIVDKNIVVMPLGVVVSDVKQSNKYKENLSKKLISVEEVDSQLFNQTEMLNVGIYVFDNEKKDNEKIKLKIKNIKVDEIDNLNNISRLSDYEKNIFSYLLKFDRIDGTFAGGHRSTKRNLNQKGIYDENEIQRIINKEIEKNCEKLKDNKIYLNTCLIGGGQPFYIIGKRIGNIYDNKADIIKDLIKWQTSSGYNYLYFDSKKAAENCKIALQNPLLRYGLYNLQDGQLLSLTKCYKYVPNINWEDDRVKTDEGLLKVCGCPKDKCKEYAEYCKEKIEDIDNKYNNLKDRRGFNARI